MGKNINKIKEQCGSKLCCVLVQKKQGCALLDHYGIILGFLAPRKVEPSSR